MISCVAVFFLSLASGVDEINHEMSKDLVEYFDEGFELFLSIEGDYSIPHHATPTFFLRISHLFSVSLLYEKIY